MKENQNFNTDGNGVRTIPTSISSSSYTELRGGNPRPVPSPKPPKPR